MKYSLRFLTVLLAIGLVYFSFRIVRASSDSAPLTKQKETAKNTTVQRPSQSASSRDPQISATAQAGIPQITNVPGSSNAQQLVASGSQTRTRQGLNKKSPPPNISRPGALSPLNSLSPEEAAWYPGAFVVAAEVVPGPGPNQQTHVRILQTSSPSLSRVRIEQVTPVSSSEVVSSEEMSAGQILVTLADGASPEDLMAALPNQLSSFAKVTPNDSLYTFQLASADLASLPDALDAVNNLQGSSVVAAQPNYIFSVTLNPNDPYFRDSSLWGLHNIGQNGGTSDADIDAPEGWDLRTAASSTLVVAVIDSGVRYTHEDLAANMWKNPNEIPNNGIDDDNNGYVDDVYGINAITPLDDKGKGDGDPMDDNGHGTHVAGIIGAVGNNAKGVTGVAWTVKIMACKFTAANGKGSDSNAIKCIQYAIDNGAKIMNNSWGGDSDDPALQAEIAKAQKAGILFVTASGNGDSNGNAIDNDSTPHYPSSYSLVLDNVIAVAATDHNDTLTTFSNYGATSVDLAAPGEDIWSTYIGTTAPTKNSNTTYASLSGTSMATPYVSGALALLTSMFPNEGYISIKNRLYDGTDKLTALSGKCVTGGRLNLFTSLHGAPPRPTPTPRPTPVPRSTPTRRFSNLSNPSLLPTATPMSTETPSSTPGPGSTQTPRPTITPNGTPTP